jgi:surface protein
MKKTSTILFILGLLTFISCGTESNPSFSFSTTVSPSEGGSITPSSGFYAEGETITLQATPANGWTFLRWEGDWSSEDNPTTITIQRNYHIIGVFHKTVYLGENGITIMCPNSPIGQVVKLNGVEYEVVDRDLLIKRRDERADLSRLCVSNVTDMSRLFRQSFLNDTIGNWDVSKVTDMSEMFSGYPFNPSIGDWDVSNVTNMSRMFLGATSFNQPIGDWDVSKVTDMSNMFYGSQFNQPIGDWDVSNVTNMGGMFFNTPFNQPIGNWDVSKVTHMNAMFMSSHFNQSIGIWDVSNVTDMNAMFYGAPFNQTIGNWDVSKVTNMSSMFWGAPFNQPIGDWDVSSVTDMGWMFSLSQFNQPIGNWDVSKVIPMTNVDGNSGMSAMFSNNSYFNQDLESWCVVQFPNKPFRFDENTPQWVLPKPVWGTCPSN